MYQLPSRREKREEKFYRLAEKGNFQAKSALYLSEAKKLQSQGFAVLWKGDNKSKQLPLDVSWANAFNYAIPPIVNAYIIGEIETFPKHLNWAQELYVIAARANAKKVSTNTIE